MSSKRRRSEDKAAIVKPIHAIIEDDVEASNKVQLQTFSHFNSSESSSKPYSPYLNEKTVSRSIWLEENKLALITDIHGKFWRMMGFTCNGKSLLQPEEALFLLERGQLIVEKHMLDADENEKLHPHHRRYILSDFYDLIVKETIPFDCYLVYLKLRSLNYVVVRHIKQRIVAIDSDEFLLELKTRFDCTRLLDAAVSFNIYMNSREFKKTNLVTTGPLAHVIVISGRHTLSAHTIIQLLDESSEIPIVFAFICPSGSVLLEEFADASVLNLDNSTAILGAPVKKGKKSNKSSSKGSSIEAQLSTSEQKD
jgi:hypothetical protein